MSSLPTIDDHESLDSSMVINLDEQKNMEPDQDCPITDWYGNKHDIK